MGWGVRHLDNHVETNGWNFRSSYTNSSSRSTGINRVDGSDGTNSRRSEYVTAGNRQEKEGQHISKYRNSRHHDG